MIIQKKKLGKDICNKILKIYNSETEIDIEELPNQFVFKTNHGSMSVRYMKR